MSIQDEIANHIDGERLFVLRSDFWGEETPRTFIFSMEVKEVIDGVGDQSQDRMLFTRAKATFDAFIELSAVTLAPDPFDKSATAIIAQVDSAHSGLFDFRITDPKPGL
jgi:hypothetical protein